MHQQLRSFYRHLLQGLTVGLSTLGLFSSAARSHHDDVPDPPPQSSSNHLAALPNLVPTAITVSGISSGGFFAHQFHVAYSKLVNGAGIIAGGPLPAWRMSRTHIIITYSGQSLWIGFRRRRSPARITSATLISVYAPPHRKLKVRLKRSGRRGDGELSMIQPISPMIAFGCSMASTMRLCPSPSPGA